MLIDQGNHGEFLPFRGEGERGGPYTNQHPFKRIALCFKDLCQLPPPILQPDQIMEWDFDLETPDETVLDGSPGGLIPFPVYDAVLENHGLDLTGLSSLG